MRLVFAGTPAFARVALEALIDAGHEIALVLTQPDRPSGRGMKTAAGPVKAFALERGLAVAQPQGLRIGGRHDADARAAHRLLESTPHDAMIVAAYGLILPQTVLDVARLGCMNIHASLLPRWRGAAPVERAIEAGDRTTGVSIMRMDAGLDTGPVIATRTVAIADDDTGGTLTTTLAATGARAMVDVLASGSFDAHPQPADGATYAAKIAKDEAALDFDAPSRTIVDRVRAFDPRPGCTIDLVDAGGTTSSWKAWRAEVAPVAAVAPGALAVVDGRIVVGTRDGAVALTELQKPGGRRQPGSAFASELATGSLRLVPRARAA